jgi:hypothetical protein
MIDGDLISVVNRLQESMSSFPLFISLVPCWVLSHGSEGAKPTETKLAG